MRKTIMSVVIALALASVASALPTMTGGAGTIYIDWLVAGTGQVITYIDVDSSWAATTGLVTLTTVTDTGIPAAIAGDDAAGYGVNSAWSADMGGSLHNGTLLTGSLYNGGVGHDLLSVNGATVGLLNDGSGATYNLHGQVTVDAGFTPNGEAKGIATCEMNAGAWTFSQDVWTESSPGSGVYSTQTALPANLLGPSNAAFYGNMAYAPTTAEVAGNAVTGMLLIADGLNYGAGSYNVVYKKATGGYVMIQNPGVPTTGIGSTYYPDETQVMLGDTNDDGIADAYYVNGASIGHGQDGNSDGDFSDANESIASGVPWTMTQNRQAATLVEGADGSWAIITMTNRWDWDPNWNMAWITNIKIYPLNAAGNYVAGVQDIVTGYDIFPTGGYGPGMVFMEKGVIPEPGTMLLVGTGVLGLAGFLRRRLLS